MATATAAPEASYDEWRDRRWRLTGLAFALLWLVTTVAVVLAAEKRSDLGTLEAGIADGSVSEVEVVGLPEHETWRGRTTVTLRWEGAVLSRYAEVTVESHPRRSWTAQGDRIVGDPVEYLRVNDPDLDATYSDHSGYQEWRGWRGPGVPFTLGLAAWFGTVLLAGSGPEPWRATQWAWIWLILFGGPLASVAFLLLGGPLGLWRPRDPRRRLTGGWAFLLSLALFGGGNAG